ncbi:tRNA N6-adenosine threonylcarbamoyltransferase, mitochondrial, partial [Tolypocladium paradoxum]
MGWLAGPIPDPSLFLAPEAEPPTSSSQHHLTSPRLASPPRALLMLRPRCRRSVLLRPRPQAYSPPRRAHARTLLALAIETSCDDTAVAILSRSRTTGRAALLFDERVASDNRAFGGVNPAVAVQGHNASLAPL